jgi:hypothetical protein
MARLAEAGKPMSSAVNSFAEYAPEPNPETKKNSGSQSMMIGR